MQLKDAGFTLIEAMTVLAIVAIGLVIGVPGVSDAMQRMRVTTTVNLLASDMAMARSTAVMRRSRVAVCARDVQNRCSGAQDWSGGWLVFADPDGNAQPDIESDLLRITDAPGAALLFLPASRSLLRYQADGRAAGTNLTVNVCRRGQLAALVVVNNLGRVRSERPNAASPCPA